MASIEIVTGEGSHVGVTAAIASYEEDSLFNVIGRTAHFVYFGGLWLLAVAGLWLSRREWRGASLLILVQVSQTAMYLLFHPSTRYRSPTDPLLFVFSAYAVVWAGECGGGGGKLGNYECCFTVIQIYHICGCAYSTLVLV